MAAGQGGRGWSKIVLGRQTMVLDQLEGLRGRVEFAPDLAWDEKGAAQSSHNHEGNAWTAEALRALINGNKEQLDRALDVLVRAYFGRELSELWGPEQFAPAAHDHQELAATSLSRVVAVMARQMMHPDASELLKLSSQLLCKTVSAMKAVATPDLQVWSAGMRPMQVEGSNPPKYLPPRASMSTAWLRMVLTKDSGLPSLRGKRATQVLRDPGMVCLRALKWLLDHGDDLGGAAAAPIGGCTLRVPMVVYRGDGAHLAVLEQTPAAPSRAVCHWCLVPYLGKRSDERTGEAIRFGTDWRDSAPEPPRGSYTIRFQGRQV